MDEEKLSNPFDKKSDDFLSFQASTPQSSPGKCEYCNSL